MNTEEYVYRELAAQRPDVISSLIQKLVQQREKIKSIVQNTMIGLQRVLRTSQLQLQRPLHG